MGEERGGRERVERGGREKERRERKREGGGNGREREVKGCFFLPFDNIYINTESQSILLF